MRAVHTTPDGPARVEITEVDAPRPAADEAVVAVSAFAVNRGELALVRSRPAGWRPGQDVAGTVTAAAADGSGPPVGSRVACLVEQAGWAERVAVPTRRLAVVPDGVDLAAAATLGMAGRTALRTVAIGGALLGRRVLVTGAAGGVGRFQVALAAAAGAQVTAVTRRPGAAAVLTGFGARVVEDVAAAAGPFDLVLDGVGGRMLAAAMTTLAPGATLVLVGASDPEPAPVALLDFVGREDAVLRTYFSYAQPEDELASDLAALLGLLAAGRLGAPVGWSADWAAVDDALTALEQGQVDGKAVLTVGH